MHKHLKTIILLLTAFVTLCSFHPQLNSTLIGSWTQTEAIHVSKHPGSSKADTTTSHDAGFAITFTTDSQYHFTAPYGHKADGTFSSSSDTLIELAPKLHAGNMYRILMLTDHLLKTQAIGSAESAAARETITTYTR